MSNENVEKNESMFEPIKNDESRVDALKHNKEKLEGLGLDRTETCCPSSLASDDGTVYCDTGDLIDDLLGMPRCTPEEKAARRERSRKFRERLTELERENQEWQKFRRKYLLEAEERARRDYEALKS